MKSYKKFPRKESPPEKPALYKLIKTTKNNVIIRRDGTNKIYLFRNKDQKFLRKNKIDNLSYCFMLSEEMRASKYIAGLFKEAVQAAKDLIAADILSPLKEGGSQSTCASSLLSKRNQDLGQA